MRAQAGIDAEVVGGVVAVVAVVGEKWVEPDGVEAHFGHVVQLVDDAAQGAAVDVVEGLGGVPGTAVSHMKAVGENLVHNGILAPGWRGAVAHQVGKHLTVVGQNRR
jgi:hypothetical protein